MAEWRAIEDYPGYRVSDEGQVFSEKTNKLMKIANHSDNYKLVCLTKNGKCKTFLVHRLIYEAFVGAIPKGYEVNYKDEDKSNNRLDNLELLTHRKNMLYGTRVQRVSDSNRKAKGRKVFQYTLDGILVRVWRTMADAHDNGFHRSGICNCCRGRNNQYKGYQWSYGELAC